MQPQRQVRDDDRAGLGAAECDLVVRLGVGPSRVETDDGHPLGGAASQVLAAELDRAADDRDVDAGASEQVVQVVRTRNDLEARFRKARKRRGDLKVVLLQQPVRPLVAPLLHFRESQHSS